VLATSNCYPIGFRQVEATRLKLDAHSFGSLPLELPLLYFLLDMPQRIFYNSIYNSTNSEQSFGDLKGS
jgi:hypothetical protein